ncbi:MAG TPA: hypothetical protein VGW38_16515, partial [Chloroflexota bacterium]|nr:hypothetical protein [Chloroflexota bacterium]
PRVGSRLTRVAVPALLALFCVGVAMAAPTGTGAAEPALSISIPAISDGVLALAQAPSGERVLLNGGPGTSSATALLGQYLRPWDRIVDLAVATDPREAYVLGLPRVLERYRTGVLLDSTAEYASAAHRHLRNTARRHHVARSVPQPGTEYVVGRTLRVEILGEPDLAGSAPATMSPPRSAPGGAAAPLTLRLRWGAFSLLVPGDLSPAEHRRLLAGAQALHSTAVLLTARATRDPNTAALLRAAEPELVIVQGELRAAPGTTSPPSFQPVPLGGDMPEPTWHFTAQGGPVRLEVSHGEYRIIRR